jgi:hypothetical protein
MNRDQCDRAILAAASRIVSAFDALPSFTRHVVTWQLVNDESHTLWSIGRALASPDAVGHLTRSLEPNWLIGDIESVYECLGDVEPWATTRDSLGDAIAAFRATHPQFLTAHDRRLGRRRPSTPTLTTARW